MSSEHVTYLVKKAVEDAGAMKSKMPPETLDIPGMSGKRGRHLLNNLATWFTPYIEVGTHVGSTLISAAYHNKGLIVGNDCFVGVDQYDPYNPPYVPQYRRLLMENMARYAEDSRPSFIDSPCWGLNLSGFKCCFFDGGHLEIDHANSLPLIRPWMTDTFVFVVDDWMRDNVRTGTFRGMEVSRLRVDYQHDLPGTGEGDNEGFWCGMAVFVLSKV